MLVLTDKSPALCRKCELVKGRFIISGPGILVSEEKTGRGMDNFSSFSDTSHNMNVRLVFCLQKVFANCPICEKGIQGSKERAMEGNEVKRYLFGFADS